MLDVDASMPGSFVGSGGYLLNRRTCDCEFIRLMDLEA